MLSDGGLVLLGPKQNKKSSTSELYDFDAIADGCRLIADTIGEMSSTLR